MILALQEQHLLEDQCLGKPQSMQPQGSTTDSSVRKCIVSCIEEQRTQGELPAFTVCTSCTPATAARILLLHQPPFQLLQWHTRFIYSTPAANKDNIDLISHHSDLVLSKAERKVGGSPPYKERKKCVPIAQSGRRHQMEEYSAS